MIVRADNLEFQYQNNYYRVVRYDDGLCGITLYEIACRYGFVLRTVFDVEYKNSEDCLKDWNELVYFIKSRKEIRVCA